MHIRRLKSEDTSFGPGEHAYAVTGMNTLGCKELGWQPSESCVGATLTQIASNYMVAQVRKEGAAADLIPATLSLDNCLSIELLVAFNSRCHLNSDTPWWRWILRSV